MRLVTIDNGSAGTAGAVLRSGEILNFVRAASTNTIESWIPGELRAILAAGPRGLDVVRTLVAKVEGGDDKLLQRLRRNGALTGPDTPLLAPLPAPGLMVAAGLAYKSHLAEMSGTPIPKQPTAFMKSPNSITGPGAAVALPACRRACRLRGRARRRVRPRVPRRDARRGDGVRGRLHRGQRHLGARLDPRGRHATHAWEARQTWEVNIMGKQYDGFTPLGPVLLTADEVPDPGKLQITTRLNGEVMQHAPVSDLIFKLQDTISYLSRWYTFRPGDVLLTGTPAGVGVGRRPPVFMHAGDVVEVEISGIGILRNTIQACGLRRMPGAFSRLREKRGGYPLRTRAALKKADTSVLPIAAVRRIGVQRPATE